MSYSIAVLHVCLLACSLAQYLSCPSYLLAAARVLPWEEPLYPFKPLDSRALRSALNGSAKADSAQPLCLVNINLPLHLMVWIFAYTVFISVLLHFEQCTGRPSNTFLRVITKGTSMPLVVGASERILQVLWLLHALHFFAVLRFYSTPQFVGMIMFGCILPGLIYRGTTIRMQGHLLSRSKNDQRRIILFTRVHTPLAIHGMLLLLPLLLSYVRVSACRQGWRGTH